MADVAFPHGAAGTELDSVYEAGVGRAGGQKTCALSSKGEAASFCRAYAPAFRPRTSHGPRWPWKADAWLRNLAGRLLVTRLFFTPHYTGDRAARNI